MKIDCPKCGHRFERKRKITVPCTECGKSMTVVEAQLRARQKRSGRDVAFCGHSCATRNQMRNGKNGLAHARAGDDDRSLQGVPAGVSDRDSGAEVPEEADATCVGA